MDVKFFMVELVFTRIDRANFEDSKLVAAGIINKEAITFYIENKDHWRLWKFAVLEKWLEKWIYNSETHVQ